MKFLIDAQLPRRLGQSLARRGHDAIHTLDLPRGNRTADHEICALADESRAVVITKDADFVISRTLRGSPCRLLVISTGNIGNSELILLIENNLPLIESALAEPGHAELGRETFVVHD